MQATLVCPASWVRTCATPRCFEAGCSQSQGTKKRAAVRVAPISGGEDAACGDMDSLPSRQKNQNPLKVALDRKKMASVVSAMGELPDQIRRCVMLRMVHDQTTGATAGRASLAKQSTRPYSTSIPGKTRLRSGDPQSANRDPYRLRRPFRYADPQRRRATALRAGFFETGDYKLHLRLKEWLPSLLTPSLIPSPRALRSMSPDGPTPRKGRHELPDLGTYPLMEVRPGGESGSSQRPVSVRELNRLAPKDSDILRLRVQFRGGGHEASSPHVLHDFTSHRCPVEHQPVAFHRNQLYRHNILLFRNTGLTTSIPRRLHCAAR